MQKHMNMLLPASAFPDWGYLCNTPAGEAGHWPPFIEAYLKYLNSNYQKGTQEYDELVAFLLGVETH